MTTQNRLSIVDDESAIVELVQTAAQS